jgi:large subunit ribosomal protein L9
MEIILKEEVDKLGSKDDLVKVKDGYARNFLIPSGKAIFASPAAKKMREENLKQRAHKLAKIKEVADKTAKDLQTMVVTVGAKVGESGKIFGSVTSLQLAEAIKKLGIEVERKNISINDEPIKHVGKYTANVKLHKEITVQVTFEVVEE